MQATKKQQQDPARSGLVDVGSIMYCKTEGHYTRVYFEDYASMKLFQSLKTLEKILPEDTFFRNYKDSMINLQYIKKVPLKSDNELVMVDGQKFNLAKHKKDSFLKALKRKYTLIS